MQVACMHVFSTMDEITLFLLTCQNLIIAFKVTSSIKFVWVERGTVKMECLAREHNIFPRIGYSCVLLKLPCTDF